MAEFNMRIVTNGHYYRVQRPWFRFWWTDHTGINHRDAESALLEVADAYALDERSRNTSSGALEDCVVR